MDQLEEALRRRAKEEDKRESGAIVNQDVKVRMTMMMRRRRAKKEDNHPQCEGNGDAQG